MSTKANSTRIYAIDVLRGITVAAMIMVNNAGGDLSYAPLQHSEWNGLTLCDMVFPSFLFIVGMTAYISLSKSRFEFSGALFAKILRRTLTILLIGLAMHWIEKVWKGRGMSIDTLRFTGVLTRIALCYFAVSVMALVMKTRTVLVTAISLLLIYAAVLVFGNGYANDPSNVLSVADRAILGEQHLYTKRPIDPEGLISTVGAIAHTLIGFMIGSILFDKSRDNTQKLLQVSVIGFVMLLAGMAIAPGLPLNKRVWSPSFVLESCGLVALALVSLSYVCDIKGHKRAFRFFDVFGVNPLFLYVLSEIVAIALSATKSKGAIYHAINSIVPDPYMASAVYSVVFIIVMWAAGYPLYKRKIYIKI